MQVYTQYKSQVYHGAILFTTSPSATIGYLPPTYYSYILSADRFGIQTTAISSFSYHSSYVIFRIHSKNKKNIKKFERKSAKKKNKSSSQNHPNFDVNHQISVPTLIHLFPHISPSTPPSIPPTPLPLPSTHIYPSHSLINTPPALSILLPIPSVFRAWPL